MDTSHDYVGSTRLERSSTLGMIHISELDTKRVNKVTDVLKEGDEVLVKVISIDRQGKIRLSRKEAMGEKPEHIHNSR